MHAALWRRYSEGSLESKFTHIDGAKTMTTARLLLRPAPSTAPSNQFTVRNFRTLLQSASHTKKHQNLFAPPA